MTRRFFFDDAEAVQRLRNAFAEWRGTPFRPFSRAKGEGGGIDCVGFAEELLHAAGAVEKFTFPRSSADYQGNAELRAAKVLRYLRGEIEDDAQSAELARRFAELELPVERVTNPNGLLFQPGDLLVLQHGSMFHLPVTLDGRRFAHCAYPNGVDEGNIHDPTFSRHLVAHFRARAHTT